MSRKDAIVLASRMLALLLTVWALAEVSNLPASLFSFLARLHKPGAGVFDNDSVLAAFAPDFVMLCCY